MNLFVSNDSFMTMPSLKHFGPKLTELHAVIREWQFLANNLLRSWNCLESHLLTYFKPFITRDLGKYRLCTIGFTAQ